MEQHTGGGPVGTRNNGNAGARAREMRETASHQLEELRDRFGDVNERVVEFIRERPGTSILIALGAGFLIGRLLRS